MTPLKYDATIGWTANQAVGDNLDYSFDYSDWLDPGDTIYTSTWSTINTTGISITREQLVGNVVSAYITCNIANTDFVIKNTSVTVDGRTVNTQLTIKCKAF